MSKQSKTGKRRRRVAVQPIKSASPVQVLRSEDLSNEDLTAIAKAPYGPPKKRRVKITISKQPDCVVVRVPDARALVAPG